MSVTSFFILSVLAKECGLTPEQVARKWHENEKFYLDFWNQIIDEKVRLEKQDENNQS